MSISQRIEAKFEKLLKQGTTILAQSGFDGSEYSRFPSDIDYRRFRAECLNLVKRVCGETSDHYLELKRLAEGTNTSTNSYYFKDCYGVLQAAHNDYDDGLLFDLRSLIAAEVLGDFLDQSENLVSQGYFVPAASLAGSVLEDTLRKLCETHNIEIPTKTKIDRLNADLARASIYNKLVQKRITALADIRNNADHGKFEEFSKEDVEDMVIWIRRFSTDYLE